MEGDDFLFLLLLFRAAGNETAGVERRIALWSADVGGVMLLVAVCIFAADAWVGAVMRASTSGELFILVFVAVSAFALISGDVAS